MKTNLKIEIQEDDESELRDFEIYNKGQQNKLQPIIINNSNIDFKQIAKYNKDLRRN